MNSEEFSKSVARTWNTDLPKNEQLMHAACTISEEGGEALSEVNKWKHRGKSFDEAKFYDECGDVLFGIQAALNTLGNKLTLEDLMQMNSEKLAERHPSGFNKAHYN